ncbi:MAG TPA: branched-chain amino acid ABC transporter permease [Streptosporangiaceae bacterium]|nr:branched-chain amino acid ABC transporter permease [Streptosporangiaceae bacterium]
MSNLMLGVGFGLVTASILALATVPLSLQMSVARIPNFAHGEILTAGAYAAYVVNQHISNIYLEALAAALVGGAVAYLMNVLLLQPFARRRPKLLILFILTIAASLIIQNLILLFFTGNSLAYRLPPSPPHKIGPFLLTGLNLFTIAAAIVVMIAVHVLLKYTKFGKAQRAVADSKDLAQVTGINSERIVQVTWLLDGLIAGFAGFLLGVSSGTLTPTLGQGYLLVIFAAAILGGIGKPYGAMAGAIVIGVAMEISALYIPASYKEVVAFGLLILTLLLRPNGIFAAPRAAGAAGATA